MILNVDWLGIASWLAMFTMALEYYISNFIRPGKWKEIKHIQDPEVRDERRKRFSRICNFIVFPLLALAVAIGFMGIVIRFWQV